MKRCVEGRIIEDFYFCIFVTCRTSVFEMENIEKLLAGGKCRSKNHIHFSCM